MGGMCLGYSRKELEERADWIIDFSELGPVIDRPLRTYSSGMKMRLMYSVAFCSKVEIMIIDEALSTARRIAENAPIATRQAKKSIDMAVQVDFKTGYAFEIEAYNRMVPTEDRQEGVRAFNEKRQPRFKGR